MMFRRAEPYIELTHQGEGMAVARCIGCPTRWEAYSSAENVNKAIAEHRRQVHGAKV